MKKTESSLLCKCIISLFLLITLAMTMGIEGKAEKHEEIQVHIEYKGLMINPQGKWETVPLTGAFDIAFNNEKVESKETKDQSLAINLGDKEEGLLKFSPKEMGYKNYVFDDSTAEYEWKGEKEIFVNLWAYGKQGLFSMESYVDGLYLAKESSYVVIDETEKNILEFTTENGKYLSEKFLPAGSYRLHQVTAPENTKRIDDVEIEIVPYKNENDIYHIVVNNTLPARDIEEAKDDEKEKDISLFRRWIAPKSYFLPRKWRTGIFVGN